MGHERRLGGAAVICAFNLGTDPLTVALPDGDWRVIEGPDFTGTIAGREIVLPPSQALFAEPA